jgi:hypothetical protein
MFTTFLTLPHAANPHVLLASSRLLSLLQRSALAEIGSAGFALNQSQSF